MAAPSPSHGAVLLGVLLLLLAAPARAACPNSCNGHGRCVGVARCECFGAWAGGDCSLRRCPTGRAWADKAAADDTAHLPLANCSNRGRCDERSGECECMQGFSGAACERMACPLGCDAHGTCNSMRVHAQMADLGAEGRLVRDPDSYTRAVGAFPYDTAWDADMVAGCTCDAGYAAWDCAERPCVLGDDPLTTGQADEQQLLRCDIDPVNNMDLQGDQFTLSFRNAVTRPFSPRASPDDLRRLLEELPTVGSVSVTFDGEGSVQWCDARFQGAPGMDPDVQPASSNVVRVTFLTDHGPLPRLLVLDQTARPLYGVKDNAVFTAAHGETLVRTVSVLPAVTQAVASVTGSKESIECSGRGHCDRRSGICSCFAGFTGSDGRGARGLVADCGHAYLPVTSCPESHGVECSGHGTCAGHPTYKCACFDGWFGGATGDCSRRGCPMGAAWFDTPYAPNAAHAPAECSNKGACQRSTGRCLCQEQFEGEACERMTCPGTGNGNDGGVCSGHGRCLTMRQLALLATDNGDPTPFLYGADPNLPATWDGDKVRGCSCDAGWQGHDCEERTCLFGNDISILEADPTRLDALQYLRCSQLDASLQPGDATVTLSFRGARTVSLPFAATAAEVQAALEALPTIGRIAVTFSRNSVAGSPDQLCLPGANSQIVHFAFITEHGNVPPIRVVMDEGTRDPVTGAYGAALGFLPTQLAFFGGDPSLDFGDGGFPMPTAFAVPRAEFAFVAAPAYVAAGIRALELRIGTSGNDECSARGICDREQGQCMCFLGYGASDGARNEGFVDDCGWREEVTRVRGSLRRGGLGGGGGGGVRAASGDPGSHSRWGRDSSNSASDRVRRDENGRQAAPAAPAVDGLSDRERGLLERGWGVGRGEPLQQRQRERGMTRVGGRRRGDAGGEAY